jgi:lipopolysaccharide transport system permease protein
MLLQVNFPREALVVAGVMESLFNLAARLLVVLVLLMFFSGVSVPSVAGLIVGMLGILLIGTAIGVSLVPIGTLYGDVNKGLVILLQLWFFVTPVAYQFSPEVRESWIYTLNPAAAAIDSARASLLGEPLWASGIFLAWVGFSVLVFLLAMVVYRVSIPVVIERMSG